MKDAQQLSCVTIWLDYHVKMEVVRVMQTLIGKNRNAVKFKLFSTFCQLIFFFIVFFKVVGHSFNQKCATSDECDKTKNLMCKDGICQCKDNSLYWNEKFSLCGKLFEFQYNLLKLKSKNIFILHLKVTKLSIYERCLPNDQCNDIAGLSCQDGSCKCENSFYWKVSKCGN